MITAVVGGQFGSEGKGAVVAHIARLYDFHVRVGAANAGHTIYTNYPCINDTDGDGHCGRTYCPDCPGPRRWVLQQLPCAAYAHPEATLLLGPGALISKEVLEREIIENVRWRERQNQPVLRLIIDHRAHVVTADHILQEAGTDLAERIGSTSTIAREGIGAATAARVMRTANSVTAEDIFVESDAIELGDVPKILHGAKNESHILLEGTQGTGLSLTTGFFPYTTSRNTTAAGLLADCGLGPGDLGKTIVVMRTYPIRVAGNSGPFFPDSREITFEDLNVEPERTTVTKLMRRIATFSMWQAKQAVDLNAGRRTRIALMFGDYIAPELEGATEWPFNPDSEGLKKLDRLIVDIQVQTGAMVDIVGTGPDTILDAQDI
jgi:adenylosuccinate synthase